ncbi:MAG: hypothetical protein GY750_15260 [Lentisphaerae bacterium]|nr:hypothetical protein [Lentisphaerota bacterium]MCP4102756.1 hypothetical protein [Lentisphaerota bacterium]
MSNTVTEISNNLENIIRVNNKYKSRHVRYSEENGFYFHDSISFGFGHAALESRNSKRTAAKEKIYQYFLKQFPQLYTRYDHDFCFSRFENEIRRASHGGMITGEALSYLCKVYLRIHQKSVSHFHMFYGGVLSKMYSLYREHDVIIIGHNHSIHECRGDSFLKDFLLWLQVKKNINTSRNHVLMHEILMSLHSHYRRRKLSDYSPESEYHFQYDPSFENPNSIANHMDFLSQLPGEKPFITSNKLDWYLQNLENVYFYDDNLTYGILSPPNPEKIIHDDHFSSKLFYDDLKKVKRIHGLPNFKSLNDKRLEKRKNGTTISYYLRWKNNVIIGRRMLNDICKFNKVFITIGRDHILEGEGVVSLQDYIKTHLSHKRILVVRMLDEDRPVLREIQDKHTYVEVAWPNWMHGLQ